MRERAAKIVVTVVGLLFLATTLRWADILWHRTEAAYAEAMMFSLYVVLGVFLLMAARDPGRHRSLIGFAAWSSFAHAGTMAVQATTDVSERMHLVLGVAMFTLVGVALLVVAPAKAGFAAAGEGKA